MKSAIEQFFNGTVASTPLTAYDATKISVGARCGQFSFGSTANDKFAGPQPPAIGYLGESALAIPGTFCHPVKITDDLWWIFVNDAAAAAATRRIQLWTWIPSTNAVTLMGAITLTYPLATVHTMRGLRAIVTNVTTGTVAVSGTAVTGTGTDWANGISVGSRIGFGSTNPNAISTWYEISAVGSGTSITLTGAATTFAGGTPYVIQDMMILTTTTNATATAGGLYVTKGLRYELFTQPATTIPAATTVDKIRAVYFLKDASTQTNIAAGGSAINDMVSLTEQFVYVLDGAATTAKIYGYNFRSALTGITAGAAVLASPALIVTGNQTVTGNILQLNNGRVDTVAHGPGSGVKSLYFLTTTRVVRAPISGITNGSTTFVTDNMAEVVPSGTNSHIATATFTSFDVSATLDRFFIAPAVSTGTMYVTKYDAGGAQFERRAGSLTNQLSSSLRDAGLPAYPHFMAGNGFSIWIEGGFMFTVGTTTTANLNQLMIYPAAADWLYTDSTADRVVCPKITLGSNAQKLYRVLVNALPIVGNDMLGVPTEAYRLKYRTSGIDDNTGTWNAVPADGNMSGISIPTDIQFAIEFRTLGVVLLPARITSLALLYETNEDLPSQYRWNFGDFNSATGTFAWIQSELFGSALGVHTIEIRRADTNALVLTQTSASTTNGVFEFWNGSAWTAGLGTDTLNVRRRFTPSGSLPGGVDLYAKVRVG